LELEARLTDALAQMPAAPVASNFTARVLAALDREEAQAARSTWRWNWQMFLPRMAVAAAVLFVAGIGIRQHEISSRHIALAKKVALVAAAQPLPSVDALENLDAIQRMSQSTHADGELLADLQ
jgi:negative regulator of sigma E activity